MAKLKAPLFSHEARGSFSPGLTLQKWKSLNVVRKKPDPTNPGTIGQQSHRDIFKQGMELWEATPWTERDFQARKSAHRLFKLRWPLVSSFVWDYIFAIYNRLTPFVFYNVETLVISPGVVRFRVTSSPGMSVNFMWVRSFAVPYLWTGHAAEISPGVYQRTIHDLPIGKKTWFRPNETFFTRRFWIFAGLYNVKA